MIYAIRIRYGREALVQFVSRKDMEAENERSFANTGMNPYRWVPAQKARAWVKSGREHETGLYIEDGKVRYAMPEMREA